MLDWKFSRNVKGSYFQIMPKSEKLRNLHPLSVCLTLSPSLYLPLSLSLSLSLSPPSPGNSCPWAGEQFVCFRSEVSLMGLFVNTG